MMIRLWGIAHGDELPEERNASSAYWRYGLNGGGCGVGAKYCTCTLEGGIDSRVCQIYSFRQVIFVRMDWGLQESIGEERSKLWSNYFLFQPF